MKRMPHIPVAFSSSSPRAAATHDVRASRKVLA